MRIIEVSGAVALIAGFACGPTIEPDPNAVTTTGGASTSTDGFASSGMPQSADTTDGGSSSSGEPPVGACDPAFDSGLASAETIWSASFTARPSNQLQYGTSIVSDGEGLVYAAGLLHSAGDHTDGWLHALDADGTPRWQLPYAGASGFSDYFSDVAIDAAGNVIVVGDEVVEFFDPGGGVIPTVESLLIALAYSPAGDLLWRTEVAAPDERGWYGSPPVVAVHADGSIVVGTASALDGGWPQPYFVELDGAGAITDTWLHPLAELRGLDVADVHVDTGGVLHAVGTGYSPATGDDVEWLGRWDDSGSFLGEVVHDHAGADAVSVLSRENGGLVLGRLDLSATAPVTSRPRLHRYGPSGEELWTLVVEYPGQQSLLPRGLASNCEGQWLVVAASEQETWLLRFDDDGVELRRDQVLADPYSSLHAITADPFGNVVVTGRAFERPQLEAFVVRKLAR